MMATESLLANPLKHRWKRLFVAEQWKVLGKVISFVGVSTSIEIPTHSRLPKILLESHRIEGTSCPVDVSVGIFEVLLQEKPNKE